MELVTREAAPAHLLVKIQSFSLHDKCGVGYETKEFVTGNYKWRLVIYPNGHGTEKPGEYVSVYLAISGTDDLPQNWEVNAVFSIFILDQISGRYHHTTGNTRRFFGLKTEWGVTNFISMRELTSSSKGYLVDDTCLFGAEVFVNDSIKVVTQCMRLMEVKAPYYHAITISDFSKLKDVWYSENFTAGGYKWKIELHPNGDEDEIGQNLSIFLVLVASKKRKTTSCDEIMKACYTIRLKNQLNSEKNLSESGSNWFDASEEGWGFPDFVSLDELNDPDGGYIVKDTCFLEIEVSVPAVAQ